MVFIGEGESLSEAGEGRFNAFENVETYGDNNEPEGEPHNRSIVGRPRTGRNPAIYPSLTDDELSGERYPGNGVNLDIYSDRERMCRLLEFLEARLILHVRFEETEKVTKLCYTNVTMWKALRGSQQIFVQEKKNTMVWQVHRGRRDELQLWHRAHWFAISACGSPDVVSFTVEQ